MYLNSIHAYVYKIRHIPTGRYYFGFRSRNIKCNRTPEQDFLVYYFTSSKIVKSMIKEYGINNFDGQIIYQSLDVEAAYWYEQDLIKENKDDFLMINRQYRDKNSSKGVFLCTEQTKETITKRKETRLKKYGTLSPIRPGSVEKMVATRKERNNYKQSQAMIEKMLATKKERGKMNSNTPESLAKARQTKMERYGRAHPNHSPETIEKLKKIPHTQEQIQKCLETKRLNGTLNSNTPQTIARRKETLLSKYGTLNTREISKLKKLL